MRVLVIGLLPWIGLLALVLLAVTVIDWVVRRRRARAVRAEARAFDQWRTQQRRVGSRGLR